MTDAEILRAADALVRRDFQWLIIEKGVRSAQLSTTINVIRKAVELADEREEETNGEASR